MNFELFNPSAPHVTKTMLCDFIYQLDPHAYLPSSLKKQKLIELAAQRQQEALARFRQAPATGRGMRHRSNPPEDPPAPAVTVPTTRRQSVPANTATTAPTTRRQSVPVNTAVVVRTTRRRSGPAHLPDGRSPLGQDVPNNRATTPATPVVRPSSPVNIVGAPQSPSASAGTPNAAAPRSPTFAEVVRTPRQVARVIAPKTGSSKVKQTQRAEGREADVEGKITGPAPETGHDNGFSDPEDQFAVGNTQVEAIDVKGKKPTMKRQPVRKASTSQMVPTDDEVHFEVGSTSAEIVGAIDVKGKKTKRQLAQKTPIMVPTDKAHLAVGSTSTESVEAIDVKGKKAKRKPSQPTGTFQLVPTDEVTSSTVGSSLAGSVDVKGKKVKRPVEFTTHDAAPSVMDFVCRTTHLTDAQGQEEVVISCTPKKPRHHKKVVKKKQRAVVPTSEPDDSSDEEIKRIAEGPPRFATAGFPPASNAKGKHCAANRDSDDETMRMVDEPQNLTAHRVAPAGPSLAPNVNPQGRPAESNTQKVAAMPRFATAGPSRVANVNAEGGAAHNDPRKLAAKPPTAPVPHLAAIDPPRLHPKTVTFTMHPSAITTDHNEFTSVLSRLNVGRQWTELDPVIPDFKPTISRIQVGNQWRYLQHGQAGHVQFARIPTTPEEAVQCNDRYYWDPKDDTRHEAPHLLDLPAHMITGLPKPLAAESKKPVPDLLDFHEGLNNWSLIGGSDTSSECGLPTPLATNEHLRNYTDDTNNNRGLPEAPPTNDTNNDRDQLPGAFPTDVPIPPITTTTYPPHSVNLMPATAAKDPFSEFVQDALARLRQIPKSFKPTFPELPSGSSHPTNEPSYLKPREAKNRVLPTSPDVVSDSAKFTVRALQSPEVKNQSLAPSPLMPPSHQGCAPDVKTFERSCTADDPVTSHEGSSGPLQIPESPALSDYFELSDTPSEFDAEPASPLQPAISTTPIDEAKSELPSDHQVTLSDEDELALPTHVDNDTVELPIPHGDQVDSTTPCGEDELSSAKLDAPVKVALSHEDEMPLPADGDNRVDVELATTHGDQVTSDEDEMPLPTNGDNRDDVELATAHGDQVSSDQDEMPLPTDGDNDKVELTITPGDQVDSAIPRGEAEFSSAELDASVNIAEGELGEAKNRVLPTSPDVVSDSAKFTVRALQSPEVKNQSLAPSPLMPPSHQGCALDVKTFERSCTADDPVTSHEGSSGPLQIPESPALSDYFELSDTPSEFDAEPASPLQPAISTAPIDEAKSELPSDHQVTLSDEDELALPTHVDNDTVELPIPHGDQVDSTTPRGEDELSSAKLDAPVKVALSHEDEMPLPADGDNRVDVELATTHGDQVTSDEDEMPLPTDGDNRDDVELATTHGDQVFSDEDEMPLPTDDDNRDDVELATAHGDQVSSNQDEMPLPTDGDNDKVELTITPGDQVDSAIPRGEAEFSSAELDAPVNIAEGELDLEESRPHDNNEVNSVFKAPPRLELIPDNEPSISFNPAIVLSLQEAMQEALEDN
ncbi:hypothetical protein PCASD_23645 [Puccinia coronata f. sp. avenae]|uniref:Uncharacterized protein n=1 Tax=Puccinia coronata f. sp. avenae TaxID=200324 RepID=A0A2N5S1B7_9BASI|nr:hypothetical protein PCASD_23645 [Puccinia coronata f. sp. avenae]